MSSTPARPYSIGIDARFYRKETGGIGRYSRELIRHLARLDQTNQYRVFLTEADMAEWELDQPNFRPVVVPAPHYSLAEQTTLLTALGRERLDLVHFLNFNHPLLYRRPFVTTLHDLTVYHFPTGRSQRSRLRRAAFLLTLRHSLSAARRVIAISEHSAMDAEKVLHLPHAKMEVIYEGAPEPVELPFGSKARVQEYLGSKQPYFLFVSQWRPHKGIVTLIEAFSLFKEKTGLPHQLVLAGRQNYSYAEVKEALERSPYLADIITPGFAPDDLLPALYRHAAAYVLPSEYEGFGLMILEAFVHGAPVISADNSSLPEVGGKAALYFPARDAGALAERLGRLASDEGLARELVEKGRAQARKFSWERCARQTLDTYLSVLEKQR